MEYPTIYEFGSTNLQEGELVTIFKVNDTIYYVEGFVSDPQLLESIQNELTMAQNKPIQIK